MAAILDGSPSTSAGGAPRTACDGDGEGPDRWHLGMPRPGPYHRSPGQIGSMAVTKNKGPGDLPGPSTMHFSRELLLVPVVPADQPRFFEAGRESLGWQFLEQLYAVVLARLMQFW